MFKKKKVRWGISRETQDNRGNKTKGTWANWNHWHSFACVRAKSLQLCLTLQPHGLYPARLLCPWDFAGKDTGVGCHVLLQGIFPTQGSDPRLLHWQADSLPLVLSRKATYSSAAAAKLLQSCLILGDPVDCSLPGSSIHGISQARGLEWGLTALGNIKTLLNS